MAECKECVHYLVCKQYKNKPFFCNQYMDYKNTVEVIRCKDCKWWKEYHCTNIIGAFGVVENENWFCCSGERKDND